MPDPAITHLRTLLEALEPRENKTTNPSFAAEGCRKARHTIKPVDLGTHTGYHRSEESEDVSQQNVHGDQKPEAPKDSCNGPVGDAKQTEAPNRSKQDRITCNSEFNTASLKRKLQVKFDDGVRQQSRRV